MDTRSPISSSLKKKHVADMQTDFEHSSQAGMHGEAVTAFMGEDVYGYDKSFIITEWPKEEIRFSPELRSALSKTSSQMQSIFETAVTYHNEVMVGIRAVDAEFDCECDERYRTILDTGMEQAGKAAIYLANRHSRGAPDQAFIAFVDKIMMPLEEIMYRYSDSTFIQNVLSPIIDHFARYYFRALLGDQVGVTGDLDNPIRFKHVPAPKEIEAIQNWASLFSCPPFLLGIEEAISVYHKHSTLPPPAHLLNPQSLDPETQVSDLYELLPYFLKGWDCSNHQIALNDTAAAYVDFVLGRFFLHLAEAGKEAAHQVRFNTVPFYWDPCTAKFCWAFDPTYSSDELETMGLELLDAVHTYMVDLYAKASFKPRATPADSVTEVNSSADNAYEFTRLTHEKFQQLSNDDTDEAGTLPEEDHRTVISTIPAIRVQRFLEFMTREHGCSVEQGKGSEIKIWRPGTRIFTLGRHKRNPTLPTWLIRQILKRVEITEREWIHSLAQL